MIEKGKAVGIAGWYKCYYGTKYDDRAYLLSKVDVYTYGDDYLKKFEELFSVIAAGFDPDEKLKLIDKAIDLLDKERKLVLEEEKESHSKSFWLKERASKLEYFKELYFQK